MGWRLTTGIATLVIVLVLGILIWAAFDLPAGIQYSNAFGSDITMTYDAADLQGQHDTVMLIWTNMNNTFDTRNYAHIYSSPWPWAQVKENSLYYTNVYFGQLITRINNNIAMLNALKANNTNPIYIQDWQTNVINQTRIEMKREGGLDWVINGAWYLTFAPIAYWSSYIMLIVAVIAIIVIVLLLISAYRAGVFN